MDEIESIKQAMTALETQRSILGDAIVETALDPLREKLALLQSRPVAEQRKLVTVLFADLVGFTSISENMDPEDVREIVNDYFTRWATCIEKHGGVVEKFIGDAVMAVFGLSISREDDPESAVRSAVEMRQALAELNNQLDKSWRVQLAMRVGIHTGTVMVSLLGERKGQDFVVVGDTVNLTSRLQSIAPSGGILISRDTFRHVRGSFEVQKLSPVIVKGKEKPIQAYQIIRAKRRSFRDPMRGVEGIESRLIGRNSELAKLKRALFSAIEDRKTQVMTVVGDAGVGKSRLIAEFDQWIELLPQGVRCYKSRTSPSQQNRPYSLLRDLFSFSFQIYDNNPPHVVQEKIERGIGEFEFGDEGIRLDPSDLGDTRRSLLPETQMRAHYIGQLLGFQFENSPYQRDALLDSRIFWERTLTYLVDYFKAAASVESIVLLLEDIHWADDASLEILDRIWERLPDEPLLVVCTARPTLFENHPEWGKHKVKGRAVFRRILLNSLTQRNSQHLVDEILKKAEDIPDDLRDLIVEKAEGNPFYIEELIKMLIEERVILQEGVPWRIDLSHLAGVQIPSTLVEILQTRLDGLRPEELVLLQRASVLGRIFWDGALSHMEKGKEYQAEISPQMIEVLKNLGKKEMVFLHQTSTFEDTREFYFIHALLRDVTYDNVIKRLRKIYHGYAAAWLETITEQSRRSSEYAAQIAEHYERADDREKARVWYQRAANQAANTYANAESIRCLTSCLALWSDEDIAGKYAILLKRVRLYDLLANRPAQKDDLESLQALAEKLDEQETTGDEPRSSRRAQVFLQWWHFYDSMGDQSSSRAAAQHALELAQTYGDKESEMNGYLYLGATLWRQSNYPAAQEYIRKALGLARVTQSRTMEGDCLRNLGVIQQYQVNYLEARALYEEAMQIYHETGNERGESMTLNSLGSLLSDQGLYREALPFFKRSLELKRKVGHRRAEHVTLLNLGILADRLGNFMDALDHLEKVQRFSAETGDQELEADALNGLGNVSLHMGDFDKAKTYLERALNLAREIGVSVNECDALQSLARLALHLGRDQNAYQLSRDALILARDANLSDQQARCLTYAANAMLNLGQIDEARKYYLEALELARQSNDNHQAIEIQAGLALAYLAQSSHKQALGVVEGILDRLGIEDQVGPQGLLRISFTQLEGLNEPFLVLLSCCQVLQALHDRRAEALLGTAYHLLLEQSDRLPAGPAQMNYLEMIPAHRELRKLCNKLAAGANGGSH